MVGPSALTNHPAFRIPSKTPVNKVVCVLATHLEEKQGVEVARLELPPLAHGRRLVAQEFGRHVEGAWVVVRVRRLLLIGVPPVLRDPLEAVVQVLAGLEGALGQLGCRGRGHVVDVHGRARGGRRLAVLTGGRGRRGGREELGHRGGAAGARGGGHGSAIGRRAATALVARLVRWRLGIQPVCV